MININNIKEKNLKKFSVILSRLLYALDIEDFKRISLKEFSDFVELYSKFFDNPPSWDKEKQDYFRLVLTKKINGTENPEKESQSYHEIKNEKKTRNKRWITSETPILELLENLDEPDPYYNIVLPEDYDQVSYKRSSKINKSTLKLILLTATLCGVAVTCFVLPFVK